MAPKKLPAVAAIDVPSSVWTTGQHEVRRVRPVNSALSFVKRWWSGRHQKLLLVLTLVVGVYGGAVDKREGAEAFLKSHSMPLWMLYPLGLSPFVVWLLLYLINETALRAAGTSDRDRWIGGQHEILRKISGNIGEIVTLRRNHGGRLTDSDAKLIVRSFLARAVDYAKLFVNDPTIEFRACCLRLRERPPRNRELPDQYLEAWEYDSSHPQTGNAVIPVGMPLAGKVAADREALIVDECRSEEWAAYFPGSRYESVVGFPLVVGQSRNGELFGVVTIDASKPGVFSRHDAARKIEDAIRPLLSSIVLVLEISNDVES